MGGDDDPLARRRGLLHIGARAHRVPGAPGNEDQWLTLAWLGSFFLLGLSAARGEVWWGFVFPVIMAGLIVEKPVAPEDARGNMAMNLVMVTALIAFVAVLSPWSRDRVDPSSGATALVSYAPQRMVDAVHWVGPDDAKLFVSLTYASWFEFASPRMPVFVDSRIELFPIGVWDDYFAVGGAREGWQARVDRWDADAVVVNPDEDEPMVAQLAKDPGWRLAYRDTAGRCSFAARSVTRTRRR